MIDPKLQSQSANEDNVLSISVADNVSVTDNTLIVDDENEQDIATYGSGSIYPYDMPDEVAISEDPYTVFQWLRKLNRDDLIIDPEFQRNLVWKPEQKSQFIESILLNIPLPPLYVNQNRAGKYIIVDGLQRTSTLKEFVTDNGFILKGLRVLSDQNGKRFEDLAEPYKTKIEDKKFTVYVIKPSVPLAMVYDIFHRINTGGTQLTRQEIRNSFYIGQSTRLLKKLSEQPYFRMAIDDGISPKRMKDREAVLRYLAFRISNYQTDYKGDMDAFLGEAMMKINRMENEQINSLEKDFERVMRLTYEFFGKNNFRLPSGATRGRINLALMESVSLFFASHSDEFLQSNKAQILKNYEKLLDSKEAGRENEDVLLYRDAIQFATGDRNRVIRRIELAAAILGAI